MLKHQRVILFTLHAYATWLPDRPQGFYRNRDGRRPQDLNRGAQYRGSLQSGPATFNGRVQRLVIEALHEAATRLDARLYCVATDASHVHFILAWNDARAPEKVQRSVKYGLTRCLNLRIGRRPWFTRQGHDRRVRDREHFLYLRNEYLPSHLGWKWDSRRGTYR